MRTKRQSSRYNYSQMVTLCYIWLKPKKRNTTTSSLSTVNQTWDSKQDSKHTRQMNNHSVLINTLMLLIKHYCFQNFNQFEICITMVDTLLLIRLRDSGWQVTYSTWSLIKEIIQACGHTIICTKDLLTKCPLMSSHLLCLYLFWLF